MTQAVKRAKVEAVSEDGCLQGQTVENYCKSCDNLDCTTCVTMSNAICSNMDTDTSLEFKELTDSLKAISGKLDHQKEVYKANKADNETFSNVTKTMIRKQREEIRNFFDKLENDMDEKVNVVTENNVKRLELVEKLQNHIQVLLSDMQKKQNSEEQLSTEKSKEGIQTLKDDLAKLKKENTIGHYKYQPSLQIQELMIKVKEFGTLIQTNPAREMEHPDGKLTGKPEDSSQKVSASTLYAEDTKTDKTSLNVEKTNNTVEHSVAIRAKTKDDDQLCTISGICCLPDGFIVAVDCGNHSVKMIDANHNKIVSVIAMDSEPHDVTKVTENTVAVTLFFERQIQFLSVSQTKELTFSNMLEASSPCYGIIHSQDKITVTHKNKLEVLDMKGKILQSFTTDSEGNQLFSHVKYLTHSPDHNTMYASDYNNNTVTSLTTDGKVKAVYKDRELQMPFGIAVDSAGFVYVCGYNSNTIHKLSADLSRGNILLDASDGIITPQSIAYCAEQNRLYVGMWCNNTIRVYQL